MPRPCRGLRRLGGLSLAAANKLLVATGSLTLGPPFCTGDGLSLTAALLVRPSAAIESLRPLQSEPGAVYLRANEQFDGLLSQLAFRSVRTIAVDALSTPNTLAADLAVVLGKGAVLMRPSDPASRADVARIESALTGAGVPILGRIEAPGLLDGGDLLLGSDTAYIGIPHDLSSSTGLSRVARGNELGRRQFAAFARDAGLKTVDVRISSDARRLRAVAAFVDRATVVVGSRVVDVAAFAGLELIDAPFGEEYGAGVLTVGRRRVIANVRFRDVLETLRRARVGVDAIDLWEFGKFGATPSMLTLALKRD